MRVLLTGDKGFVGEATKKYLAEKDIEVVGYDLMDGFDIQDQNQFEQVVKETNPDRILHLAALARFADADANPKLAFQVNVLGTIAVVQVAKKHHKPLVFASTGSAIMPLDAYAPPYKEDIPARGNSVYGVTKAIGEYYVAEASPYIILRYAHIYGKEKRGHGLVGGFLDRIKRGMAPVLYGGRQTNDFTYVEDIAQANHLALVAPWDKWQQTYHIGTGEELSAQQAGDIIIGEAREAGLTAQAPEVKEGRGVDPSRFVFDISKAKLMLGYEPQYTFKKGIKKMVEEGGF